MRASRASALSFTRVATQPRAEGMGVTRGLGRHQPRVDLPPYADGRHGLPLGFLFADATEIPVYPFTYSLQPLK